MLCRLNPAKVQLKIEFLTRQGDAVKIDENDKLSIEPDEIAKGQFHFSRAPLRTAASPDRRERPRHAKGREPRWESPSTLS
jgi:hypothetical protein